MTVQQLPDSSAPVIARVFADLAGQWRAETSHLSDDEEAAAHPIYRALIALGPRVLPFMLHELQGDNPEHWFTALEEITGENPVAPHERGRIDQMAAAWLKWGQQRGYLA
jgi:hypothetical protein